MTGRRGERETRILDNDVVGIGWEELDDLSDIKNRGELKNKYIEFYPDASTGRVNNHVGQLWSFTKKTEIGDIIVVPMKTSRRIAVGKIEGSYEYRKDLGEDMKHTIPVEWINSDIPRSRFDQDLLNSFGAYMAFYQSRAKNVEKRVLLIAQGKKEKESRTEEELFRDLEEEAYNQITDYLTRKFKGHEFTRLIAAIMEAQGYNVFQSPPGPDGGIDITASKGIFGFVEPSICVQVKSGEDTIGVNPYRELKGTMDTFNGTHGLLVSWGGFKSTTIKESKQDAFKIKLWGPQEVIDQLFSAYPDLDPDIKSILPLKQIWALAPPE